VHVVLHGVYSFTPVAEDDLVSRAQAAALVLPRGGVLARRTAAWLHGVDPRSPAERSQPVPVECVVPRGVVPVRRRGLHCFQAPLDEGDVLRIGGLPCTTPARTTLDLLRWLAPPFGLAAADVFAARELVDPDAVLTMLERWPGERFVRQARQLAGWIEPLAESKGESWLRLRILEAGFPRPRAQVPIVDHHGRELYRLDLGWEELRIGIEYDGEEYHSSPEDRRSDERRRERLAKEFGWTVTGVGMGEVFARSLALERGVGELLSLEPQIARRAW